MSLLQKKIIALFESRLAQKIYTANIIQFIATVASVLAIVKFMVLKYLFRQLKKHFRK